MYKYINGYDLETTMKQIKKYNNGTRAMSLNIDNQCSYRNEKGNRCVVGCFIPDNKSTALASRFIASEVVSDNNLEEYMFVEIKALDKFQEVHDTYNETDTKSLYEQLRTWLEDNVE